jgi:uncharacterized UBP type Zn finger protein
MKRDSSGWVRITTRINKAFEAGILDPKECLHLSQVKEVVPSSDGCEDCLKIGDSWVNLRLCLTCGKVGCCDNSKNKHASGHFHDSGHPMIVSYEEGENWLWCYVDKVGFDPDI